MKKYNNNNYKKINNNFQLICTVQVNFILWRSILHYAYIYI